MAFKLVIGLFINLMVLLISNQAVADPLKNFFSPVTTPAILFLLSGSAATGYVYNEKSKNDSHLQNEVSNKRSHKKYTALGNVVGQVIPNFLYVTGQWAFGGAAGAKRAEHMFESSLYTGLLTIGLKYSVAEERPDKSDRLSFPSGHTSMTTAFAAVVGIHHAWYWGVLSYAFAYSIAYSRMNQNQHYIHDVMAGATIGLTYGYSIYFVNGAKYKGSGLSDNAPKWNVFPFSNEHSIPGIMLTYQL